MMGMIHDGWRFLQCFSVALAGYLMVAETASGAMFDVYIGTYTGGESRGIYRFIWDAEKGTAGDVSLAAECVNPSFLAVHPTGEALFAVLETGDWQGIENSGGLAAFRRQKEGDLDSIHVLPTYGGAPCHLEIHPQGNYVFFANYSGGSIGVYSLTSDWALSRLTGFVQHSGSGINRQRQEAPHGHSIHLSPDGKFLLSADLGTDMIRVHSFDGATGLIGEHHPSYAPLTPGAGPRHFAFRSGGRMAFVINELSSELTSLKYYPARGELEVIDQVSTLPSDYSGGNSTAEVVVHPNGRFVYGSNRGHDSIAVFHAGDEGKLKRIQVQKTGGRTPRNFAVDPSGNFLLAANQNSGNIHCFAIDANHGTLSPHGQPILVPSPVCIRFAPKI
jgi:6-phosphogluconolactonase